MSSSRRLKNVTVAIEEEVARWARLRAAQEDKSVSRLIAEMLEQRMAETERYERAMSAYLARKPVALKRRGRYPRREELHERLRVR